MVLEFDLLSIFILCCLSSSLYDSVIYAFAGTFQVGRRQSKGQIPSCSFINRLCHSSLEVALSIPFTVWVLVRVVRRLDSWAYTFTVDLLESFILVRSVSIEPVGELFGLLVSICAVGVQVHEPPYVRLAYRLPMQRIFDCCRLT